MSQRNTKLRWSDERLDVLVGNLLRIGVLTAASVVLAGGVIFLARHEFALPHYQDFQPSSFRSVVGILQRAFSGSGRGLIQLGLLLLIATPVARVVLLLVGFALQRDRLYAIVSLVVLMLLLFGLFGGRL
jgi:uncharacterized membrane protein